MCTLTIIKNNSKTLITMNRDERIYLEEIPPQIFTQQHIKIISPIDKKSNGSWIAVNEFGTTACLLNRYENFENSKNSRGEIVFKVLQQGGFGKISDFLENGFKSGNYNPFILVVIYQNQIIRLDFDGKKTQIQKIELNDYFFISSSSLKWNEVLGFRQNIFENWQNNPIYKNNIPTFHLPIIGEDEKWTPFVRREKIHSKNICQIEFDNFLDPDFHRDDKVKNRDPERNNFVKVTYYPFKDIINEKYLSNCAPLKLKIHQ
jgi:hypothetical protein